MNRSKSKLARQVIQARGRTVGSIDPKEFVRKDAAEGGCGVIGIASSVPIEGRHLLQSLIQMRNRGNGKGGGAALSGLDPEAFGIDAKTLQENYLIAVAYLDWSAKTSVEESYISSKFEVEREFEFPRIGNLDPAPPKVVAYFARPKPGAVAEFADANQLGDLNPIDLEDEFVYQNSYQLNRAFYSALGETRAFVLSHGKDLLVLKLVGYGDDVIRVYGLEDLKAHVWIGHHRYPTKGRVWHPGGAHPFVGLNEALVHNGDFANYASVCSYLAQHKIRPLFLTDTEVSALVFDLHHRTFDYPLEYVIETLAPTTERDFTMLPPDKQHIYGQLQASHIHGSPDGPWFFLLAQSLRNGDGPREVRLLGITDTSMLRPQVFALQQGEAGSPSIGFAASEKQAIDAALTSLAETDTRFWTRADLVWNARGGSHTDGGAFVFSVVRSSNGHSELQCRDKFGRQIEIDEVTSPYRGKVVLNGRENSDVKLEFDAVVDKIPSWSYEELQSYLSSVLNGDRDRMSQLAILTSLLDRRYETGQLRRSSVLAMIDRALAAWLSLTQKDADGQYTFHASGLPLPEFNGQIVVVDGSDYEAQGPQSLALAIATLVDRGFRELIIMNAKGHRFIANGLGSGTKDIRIEVYGSSGDYLASGIDGAQVVVHGSGQDQLAQIMKNGKLIVYGDVGQTFMYGAKGGEAYILGDAAGRPLINAVGRPRVVINGTCLDYLAESFMAGDPLSDGGFVVLNGLAFNGKAEPIDLDTPYPGGNLFSLASGGAIFLRDPKRLVGSDQLNGGEFAELTPEHWALIRPMLEENERLFGIKVSRLLSHNGMQAAPESVYRLIVPAGHEALQPEQAWVHH